jgi:hypothetical protein
VVYGARVELVLGERRLVREVETDGSYLSAHDPRARFGLPPGSGPLSVRVAWPGIREPRVYEKLEPGRYHRLERPER